MPDPKEQETPLQNAEPKPFEMPAMAKDQIPMAESPPEDEPSAVATAEQPVRRSGRITSRPKALSDYVLLLLKLVKFALSLLFVVTA